MLGVSRNAARQRIANGCEQCGQRDCQPAFL